MSRFALIVGFYLVIGITAKPYKHENKFTDEAFQDTVMSIGENGKMSWGVQVEPPEDKDDIQFDVNPRMKIWRSMTGREVNQYLKAEKDMDEFDHPSMAELLKVQILDTLSAAEVPAEVEKAEEDRDDDYHPVFDVVQEEPEQDGDEVYNKEREELDGYLAQLDAGYQRGKEVHVSYSEPEEDLDDLYHKDLFLPVAQKEDWKPAAGADVPAPMKHTEPEEDLDALYHKDPFQLVQYEDGAQAALADLPSQMKYIKAEEDLDELYHQ